MIPWVTALAALCLLSLMTWKGAAAYLSSRDKMANQLSVGQVKTVIKETFPPVPSPKPGKQYQKQIQAVNEKGSDCYARIRVSFDPEELEAYGTIDYNRSDWEREGEYWYYKERLPEGASSSPLFQTVSFSGDTPPELMDSFDLFVELESCQAGNWDSYRQAWDHADIKQNRKDSQGGL